MWVEHPPIFYEGFLGLFEVFAFSLQTVLCVLEVLLLYLGCPSLGPQPFSGDLAQPVSESQVLPEVM